MKHIKSLFYTLAVIALIALGVYGLYKKNESLIVEKTQLSTKVEQAKDTNDKLVLHLDKTIEISDNNQKAVAQVNTVKIKKVKQSAIAIEEIKTQTTTIEQSPDKTEYEKALETSSMVFLKIEEHEKQMGNIT